ncbi:MAG: hypothetical protein WCX69_00460 [Candidatus Paceibacterota bacterium]
MNNNINKKQNSSGSVIIKAANIILAIICAFLFLLLISIYRDKQSFNWNDLLIILMVGIPIYFQLRQIKTEKSLAENKLEWNTLDRRGKIYWSIAIAIMVSGILFAIFGGVAIPMLLKYLEK